MKRKMIYARIPWNTKQYSITKMQSLVSLSVFTSNNNMKYKSLYLWEPHHKMKAFDRNQAQFITTETETLKSYQNSPSPICLTASRSFSCGGTSSHSNESRAQAPTYSPPGPMGFLNLTSCTGSPLNVSTYKYQQSKVQIDHGN